MQAIDYSKFLDSGTVRAFVPSEAVPDEDIYECDQGIRFRSGQGRSFCWETVRLAEGAFLLASQNSAGEMLNYRQFVSGSDWIHIQFRLNGGGCEDIARTGVVQTPEGSCIVSRYPQSCVVERTVDTRRGWKVACLFATPVALMDLLDSPAASLPEYVLWLAHRVHGDARSTALPLQSSMVAAVNDILSCPFRGWNRRAYMRGKSLELLSTVIHALANASSIGALTLRLSASDLERIALARSVMCAQLESSLTLSELARKTGLNRSKLALGFKAVYGVSVQAFWRDAKLDRARQMLRDGEVPVTEVALSVGYSELSSFTRAFIRRYGIAPSECKQERRRVVTRG
jgi:AraC family transcriptional regulator, transcriptional activator of the genes for pyochelin and ferripyochelin receptors